MGDLSARDNIVGVDFSFPLPILNQRQGEIAEAIAEKRILEASLYDLSTRIERDVNPSLNRLSIAGETVELYEKELNLLSKTNLEEFEKAYKAGEVGTLEVLRAQEDFNRVSEGYQDALLEYNAARVELESVLGGRIPE